MIKVNVYVVHMYGNIKACFGSRILHNNHTNLIKPTCTEIRESCNEQKFPFFDKQEFPCTFSKTLIKYINELF